MKLLTHNLLCSHVPGLRPGGGFPLRIEVRGGPPVHREGRGARAGLSFPAPVHREGPAAIPVPPFPVPPSPSPPFPPPLFPGASPFLPFNPREFLP